MHWSRGSTAELTATFTRPDGDPVDPETIYVDIFSPAGKEIDNGIPLRLSTGFYRFDLPLPEDALLGLWRIEWQAIIDGNNTFGDEAFYVTDPDWKTVPVDSTMHSRLRSRLAETKTNQDGDGSETFFTDAQIAELVAYAGDDLDLATLEGWLRKQAHYARLVDVSESGSQREMSQKFKHASEMVKFWSGLIAGGSEAHASALAGRIVGKAVNLRSDGSEPLLTPFSGYSDHIRIYPTHRLLIPAILR